MRMRLLVIKGIKGSVELMFLGSYERSLSAAL